MALVHDAKKEIHAKIVYFGPGRAGKTTNLEFIYNKLKPEYRGKFKFLNTPSGKMVFFDFMRPELGGVKDFNIHFHLYTVPGDEVDGALWKNVLKGVDGIVFVADMDSSKMLENRRSLEDLKSFLAAHDTKLEDIPCIFQFNKKDLSGAMTPDDMKNLLDTSDIPIMPSAANSGQGVLPTLSEMVKMIVQTLRDTLVVQEDELSVAAEESAQSEELQPEREEPPVTVSSYAFTAEPEYQESVGSEEPQTMSGGLADPEPEISEESILPADEPETTGFDLPSSADYNLSLDVEREAPTDTSGEGLEQPEPCCPTPAPIVGLEEVSSDISPPEIELAGSLESLGEGRYRLPLVIRYADKEKRTALTLSLDFE
jgi:signal recognition particle receptor subunit beta